MRYTIRQIEYFIAAAEFGSISVASERINISPPSISTAISQLEAELNAKLFVRRHAQGLSLTPVGREVLAEGKQLINQAQRLYQAASEATKIVQGPLSLGCLVTFAPMVLPEVAQGFAAAHENVFVTSHVADQESLLHMLEHAKLDVALSYDLQVPDEFTFVPLAELSPYAMVGQNHPLAKRTSVSLAELAVEDLVLLDLPLSRDYFLGLFAREGLRPRISMRIGHQEVIRTMVANGMGYTIGNVRPRLSAARDGRALVSLKIEGEHQPMRLGIIYLRDHGAIRTIEAFVEHCQGLISNSYIPGMFPPSLIARRYSSPGTP